MADLPITSDQGATPVVINDPTTTANVANVKAASTASVVADNSLVVALSPNSPVPTGTNKIGVTGVAQGSTTSGQNGDLIQGAVTTAAPSYSTSQTSPLSLTTVGNLRVDGSSVIQPVSGTVTANQGTPNTVANKWPIEIVDSGGVNIASVNATNELLVTDTDLTLAQGSTTSGQLGPLIQGAVTTSSPSYSTGQTDPLSLTTLGDLRVVSKTEDGFGNSITSIITRATVRGLGISNIDGPQVDSYSRLRSSSPEVEYALFFSNTNHPLYFNSTLTGSATTTYNSTLGSAQLTTTTSSSDSVVLQTKRYFRYVPGISTLVTISIVPGPQTTNVRKRWGYFDTNDGFFFEQTATDVAVTLRTSTSGSPVDTRYAQSTWNIDKLDGTGPSGVTLNTANLNLYITDFVWQGAGRLRFGIINGGTITYFHEILNSNTLTAAFMRSPSRPGRLELTNLGTTSGTNNMNAICCIAVREGTTNFAPYTFGATRGRTSVTAGTSFIPLISIQPNTTFNGVTNRVPIVPIQADIYTNQTAIIVQFIINPTLTGASFSAPNTFSAAQIDTSATALSGGTVIFETVVANSSSSEIDIRALQELAVLGIGISGSTPDILTVAVESTAGNSTTFGGITWQEYQ